MRDTVWEKFSNDYVLKTEQAHPREFLTGVSINSDGTRLKKSIVAPTPKPLW